MTTTSNAASILNSLIETCKDGENGYREAAQAAEDHSLQSLFLEYSQQRARYAAELQSAVSQQLGDAPETSGSVLAAAHRGWIDVKSAITGRDDQAILDECERGEDAAVIAYRNALRGGLPSDVRAIVARQAQGIEEAHDRVRDLKHNFRGR